MDAGSARCSRNAREWTRQLLGRRAGKAAPVGSDLDAYLAHKGGAAPRFPPPWSVEELDACFVVRDRDGLLGSELLLGSGLRYDPSRKRRVAGNLNSKPPISGAQLRAARALLKWSVRKLSDQCGVSESAISRGEQVNGTPPMQVRNLNAIRQVFEEHGIEFLGFDGVRLLAQSPELPPRDEISGQAADEG